MLGPRGPPKDTFGGDGFRGGLKEEEGRLNDRLGFGGPYEEDGLLNKLEKERLGFDGGP